MSGEKYGKGWPGSFGPNWTGKRCGARTRNGTPCQAPGCKRNGRCKKHGGSSTGPRTIEGKERQRRAVTKHGLHAGPLNPVLMERDGYTFAGPLYKGPLAPQTRKRRKVLELPVTDLEPPPEPDGTT